MRLLVTPYFVTFLIVLNLSAPAEPMNPTNASTPETNRASTVVGDLRVHEGISDGTITPRRVSVWLPPGYESEPDRRYPVLYMHDGQNCFDVARSAFGMEWQMDEEATRLISEGRIEPIIIVGIDNNGQLRREEYGDTELGAAYRRFVVETVKPLIDRTYRTKPERAHTATMGSSMGGCVSFLLAWERPDVFFGAGCLSPAFADEVQNRVRRHRGKRPAIRLYFDNGGVGLEERLQPGITMMLVRLQLKGFEIDEDLVFFYDEKAEHNEKAWAARVWRPLEFLYGVKPAHDAKERR